MSKFDGTGWDTYLGSNSGLISSNILSITIDTEGNKWFGTDGYGISKFDDSTWTTYNSSNSGLTSNFVFSTTVDAERNVWFSTFEGVSVLLSNTIAENPISKSTITGKVFLDKNKNQLLDDGEGYLKGQKVLLTPGNVTAYTNANGEYKFQADSGNTYTVSYIPSSYYTLTKDTSYTFTLKNAKEQLSPFAVFAPDTTVYQSNISSPDRGRCNTDASLWFTYTNTGTTVLTT